MQWPTRSAWRPGGRHAVLIAVTGWGQKDDKRKALSAGFDEHFTKPVDPDTLEHAIVRLLGRSETVEVAAQDSSKA